ncbi:MAG TPA: hypothetical protein VGC16_06495 [Rhizomicrobium sp.]
MVFPDAQFTRLTARLPPYPAWLPRVAAGVLLAASAGAIAVHHPWVGGALLAMALLAAGLGQANRSLSLGLLALPFGFALDDPARALAAMFLIFALAVFLVLRGERPNVSPVIWGAAAVLLLACILPDRFSLLSYLIGVTCFVAAGQGVAKRGA